MAPALVAITGKVLGPDGVGIPGGEIRATLQPPGGSVVDGSVDQVVSGGPLLIPIASDGAVAFNIIPNSGTGSITPAGSTYRAVFQSNDGRTWEKSWSVPASPASADIGDL